MFVQCYKNRERRRGSIEGNSGKGMNESHMHVIVSEMRLEYENESWKEGELA